MNDANETPELEQSRDTGNENTDDEYPSDTEGAERDEDQSSLPDGEQGDGQRSDRNRRRRRRKRDDREEAGPLANDERAQLALTFVSDVLREMGMDCRARLRRPKPDAEDPNPEIVVDIGGRDSGRIIGKKGQVLAALQFLTHRAINRPGTERRHVLVDAEGYRSRRDTSLATMAQRLGRQAVELGKIITFEPMNPRDRRVVHLALAKFEGVVTKSEGEGDDRRVQIIPVRR